jgi:hypothetical protein
MQETSIRAGPLARHPTTTTRDGGQLPCDLRVMTAGTSRSARPAASCCGTRRNGQDSRWTRADPHRERRLRAPRTGVSPRGRGYRGIRPPVPQSWRTGRTRFRSTRSTDYGTLRRTVRVVHTGSAGDHRTPGVAADPCGPRSVRGESRRGGEKPRGRNVPGEANPGIADPHTCVAEGAEEPQEGKSWILVILGPILRTVP